MYFSLQLIILNFVQILDDPSPSPSKNKFSPEFCSFVDACLQKDPDNRPTAEQVRNEINLNVIRPCCPASMLCNFVAVEAKCFEFHFTQNINMLVIMHFFYYLSEICIFSWWRIDCFL